MDVGRHFLPPTPSQICQNVWKNLLKKRLLLNFFYKSYKKLPFRVLTLGASKFCRKNMNNFFLKQYKTFFYGTVMRSVMFHIYQWWSMSNKTYDEIIKFYMLFPPVFSKPIYYFFNILYSSVFRQFPSWMKLNDSLKGDQNFQPITSHKISREGSNQYFFKLLEENFQPYPQMPHLTSLYYL